MRETYLCLAGPLVRSTEAPRAGRVTAASTGLETELFVALQYQDDEAEVVEDKEKEALSFHMLRENCVLFAEQRIFIALGIGGATVI